MVFEAIIEKKDKKGVSRPAIANYIKANFDNLAQGRMFNSVLKRMFNSDILTIFRWNVQFCFKESIK